ncbi:MAG: NRAMP family divalent metal transporter, partial [Steroidobacteraceae bacterium]
MSFPILRPKRLWRIFGPGLTTGAADDDPSGIATYSQAGAQFGYALTWTLLLTLPFMAAIQIISACIGARTRGGLAVSIARQFSRPVVYGLVLLLVVANTLNIAADLAAMGAALQMVLGGHQFLFAIAFGLGCVAAEIAVPYHRYAGYLKVLTLALLVYVAAAFTLHIPWGQVALTTFVPSIRLDSGLLLTIVAVFGTTISPYLFFWQASQEAEEARLGGRAVPADEPPAPDRFRRISVDTWVGMAFSNVIGFCII